MTRNYFDFKIVSCHLSYLKKEVSQRRLRYGGYIWRVYGAEGWQVGTDDAPTHTKIPKHSSEMNELERDVISANNLSVSHTLDGREPARLKLVSKNRFLVTEIRYSMISALSIA